MDIDTTIGLIVIAVSLIVIILLTLWSRRTIDRIADNGFGSARQIEKDRRRG